MPMPKLYVTPDQQPNAFATGRNPEHAAVAVTQGILEILDWDELRGVLAHEISHVGNRDILIGSVAAAVAMGITFIARMVMWGAMFGGMGGNDRDRRGGGIGILVLALLTPMAARPAADGASAAAGSSRPTAAAPASSATASRWPGPSRSSRPAPAASRWTSTRPRPRPTSSTRSAGARCSSPTCSGATRRPRTASPGSVAVNGSTTA